MAARMHLGTRSLPAAVLIVIALAGGLAFRLWNLFAEPLWLDEAYSAFAADHSLWYLWHVVPRYEVHPPFYYTLLHVWGALFGDALATRRLPGIVFGMVAVGATGWCAAVLARIARLPRAWRLPVAGIATALAAFHPLLIEMSRQVRAYPLIVAAYAGAVAALLSLAEDHAAGRPPGRRALVGVLAAETLILWLHDLGLFYAAALTLALAVIVARRGLSAADWRWLVGGHLAVAIADIPALVILVGQTSSWVGSTWLRFDPHAVPVDLAGIYLTWSLMPFLAGVALAVAGAAVLAKSRTGARVAAALIILAVVPAALSIGVSALIAPVFLARTLSPLAIPAILLVSLGVAQRRPWGLATLALLAVILLALVNTDRQLRTAGVQQDWYRVVAWLEDRVAPGDAVWAYPNDGALPLDYALRDRHVPIATVSIPGPMPTFDPAARIVDGNPGVPTFGRDEAAAIADGPLAARPRRIWLVQLNPALYDPQGLFADEIGRTRAPVERLKVGPILVIGFSAPRAAPAGAAAAR